MRNEASRALWEMSDTSPEKTNRWVNYCKYRATLLSLKRSLFIHVV